MKPRPVSALRHVIRAKSGVPSSARKEAGLAGLGLRLTSLASAQGARRCTSGVRLASCPRGQRTVDATPICWAGQAMSGALTSVARGSLRSGDGRFGPLRRQAAAFVGPAVGVDARLARGATAGVMPVGEGDRASAALPTGLLLACSRGRCVAGVGCAPLIAPAHGRRGPRRRRSACPSSLAGGCCLPVGGRTGRAPARG